MRFTKMHGIGNDHYGNHERGRDTIGRNCFIKQTVQ